jgi:cyclase
MLVVAAARDIALDRFAGWGEAERMVVNVASLYREFGSTQSLSVMELFGEIGRLHAELRANAESHDHGHSHAH